jgi:hypothetical protein
MKRLLTLLVVLALAGYIAFKGGVWWLTDQRFSEANQTVSDIGVIDHGWIRSGVAGSLTLVGGGYEDFRLSQPLIVGRLQFDAGSPVALIKALLDPSALPPQWLLQGEQVSMALDNALFRNWVTASDENQTPALFAPVCGPDHRQQLGSGDLLRMGISGIAGEVLFRQDAAELYGELTTVETGSIELVWPGARFNPVDPIAVIHSGAEPLTITLRDGGLMRRVSAYCSREAGLETTEWTRVVMESFRSALAVRGFRASDQLIALYRQWLTEGGKLGLELDPAQSLWGVPVSASATPFVTYNDARVPDVYLVPVEPEPEDVPVEAMEPIVDSTRPERPGWQPADPANAAALKGQTVKVTLANGNLVEGRLAEIDDERLEVVRLVNGGEVAYPVAIGSIERLEVWRRGQNP